MNELLENEEDISFESQEDRWDDLGLDIFGQNITSRNWITHFIGEDVPAFDWKTIK